MGYTGDGTGIAAYAVALTSRIAVRTLSPMVTLSESNAMNAILAAKSGDGTRRTNAVGVQPLGSGLDCCTWTSRSKTFLADLRAPLERDPAARGWLDVVLSYPGFHALVAHRFIHPLHRAGIPMLPRYLGATSRAF